MSQQRAIIIRGARQNNLRGIDIDLPVGRLIVVTGPSGGGKSSLAFNTIYAEGQRRYVETFSPYTRQFFERMDKPAVDFIDGIPPAIALEQGNQVKTTRSTVGTITEIQDYLKLLMPRVARCYCPECKGEVIPDTAQSVTDRYLKILRGKSVLVTFPVDSGESLGRDPDEFFAFLRGQGYLRALLYGKLIRTDEPCGRKTLPARIEVIQDRLQIETRSRARLQEAIEHAFRLGKGRAALIEEENQKRYPASLGWHCAQCDQDIRPPTPGLFSFNNPLGACPACRGFGRVIGIDYDRALPDRSLSLRQGVVRPFQSGFSQECQKDLLRHARDRDIDLDCPFENLPKSDQQFIIEGEAALDTSAEELWSEGRWYGVKGYFDWLESKTYKMHVRVLLSRYRSYKRCPDCHGGRYQPETLNFRLPHKGSKGLTLPEFSSSPVAELLGIVEAIPISDQDPGTRLLRDQVYNRLSYLDQVGLGYLTLDRPTRTLSGGELQRVNLTSCLGASLVNTLFVMDEPSVGLHPRDTGRLIEIVRKLRDRGNTVLVVEHEEAVIRAADILVDIGPGSGSQGGQLVYSGPARNIISCDESLTAQYLTGKKFIATPKKRRKSKDFLHFRGIRHNNLKKLDLDLPLGVFCCITGVSGSGKSSLAYDVIYRNLDLDPSSESEAPGFCREIFGGDAIEEVVMVDQSPLAKSPRSTPAVYLGVFDRIREIFGMSEVALAAGMTPSTFSFNSGKGRCERCSGLGYEKVEMQFLSDLYLRCPECEGKRYQPSVLSVTIEGKSIHDVLEMSVREAIGFFAPLQKKQEITKPLQLLDEVGLGYLRLGQPVNVLSGGEAQRLKLVKRLIDKNVGSETLFLFDEPTTGLHFHDIAQLLKILHRLVDAGASVVVVEHNLEVIKSADWILDLGPDAGDAGGRLVVQGTPETVASCAESHTGQHLKEALSPNKSRIPFPDPETFDSAAQETDHAIVVKGAREHNLKNITVRVPRDGMTVVTGLSGSGKSTLAFDILFAEGQRRFLDSMSPYARQYAEQLEKPEVDHIEGLPPTVAIEQRVTRGGGKSTVATVTEVYHFLRLLYAKLGTQYCPRCNVAVEKNTMAAATERAAQLLKSGSLRVFAPLVRGRKGFHTEVATWAARRGYEFLLVDGALVPVRGFQKLERYKEHTIDVLVGEIDSNHPENLSEMIGKALEIGRGTARVLDSKRKFHILSTEMNCPGCGTAFDELDPRIFSFNSPHGQCTHCRGFGEIFRNPAKDEDFDSVAEAEIDAERRYEKLDSEEASTCPICQGGRLNEVASNVRVQGHSICNLTALPAARVRQTMTEWKFDGHRSEIARDILPEIEQRLSFLERVGLEYLALNRSAKTLSGGESQRIRLASQLGSNLRGVLYVLDEPTIGLHPRDNERLLDSLEQLGNNGNSLLIVEHDESTMRRAKHIIDLGPGAGREGGEVVASGTLDEILSHPTSLTGKALREPASRPSRTRRPLEAISWIHLLGARKHNLVNVDMQIPVGRLTVVTGVSGSGKSTLTRGVLLPAVKDAITRRKPKITALPSWDSITGCENIGAVQEVDQSPIGKTSRSTPATYVKVFDEIRKLFAQLPEARMRGYTASRFSFNNEGGRCESCQGQGVIKLEMNFLPTSYIPCEDCSGKRFNPATLEVLYNEKSIGDILHMTISQAAEFFSGVPKVRRPLQLLVETGLGYLQLGQASPTLSGGEAQRIKLVSQLASRSSPRETNVRTGKQVKSTLTILEEPTIGLHAEDVNQLIAVIHRLVDEGATVVVIEHHLDLIAEADYVIDIGPEAGDKGGEVVATGTPEQVAAVRKSHTGQFLKSILQKNPPRRSSNSKAKNRTLKTDPPSIRITS